MQAFQRSLTLAGIALAASFGAQAQSDREVAENTMTRSERVCEGHAPERTRPVVKGLNVGALRVLAKHQVTLCPDRRLDAATPVAWYGQAKVLAWNPEVTGAPALAIAKADAMTRQESFPAETQAWTASGTEAKGAVLPSFQPRAVPAAR